MWQRVTVLLISVIILIGTIFVMCTAFGRNLCHANIILQLNFWPICCLSKFYFGKVVYDRQPSEVNYP